MTSLSELCEEQEEDEDFLSESSYSPRSHSLSLTNIPIVTRITTFFFLIIEIVISILTLSYNLYWYFYIKYITKEQSISDINVPPFTSHSILSSCEALFNWKGYIILWCRINLTKTILFFFTVKFCCGNQTDLNIPCIIIRSLLSLIPSVIFIFKLPKIIENYTLETLGLTLNEDLLWKCEELNRAIETFNYYEKFYCYSIVFIIGGIVLTFGIVFAKEFWKSRGYIQS